MLRPVKKGLLGQEEGQVGRLGPVPDSRDEHPLMALPPRKPLQDKLCAASHCVTFFLGLKCPRSIPMVFVLGYPKSGTTWAAQLVADYLQMPFPQHSLQPMGSSR